jgi:hypothetical protein
MAEIPAPKLSPSPEGQTIPIVPSGSPELPERREVNNLQDFGVATVFALGMLLFATLSDLPGQPALASILSKIIAGGSFALGYTMLSTHYENVGHNKVLNQIEENQRRSVAAADELPGDQLSTQTSQTVF